MGSPITDLVIRIKNGYLARRELIEAPYSTMRVEVLKKLKDLGYLKEFNIEGDKVKKINITLEYKSGVPAVTDVKIYSKPGSRWYVRSKDLRPVLGNLGVSLLSTPNGVLTNREAKSQNIGGELLFDIW